MRRGEQGKPRLRMMALAPGDIHPLVVHRDRIHHQLPGLDHRADKGISRIFHPHMLPRLCQSTQDQVHSGGIVAGDQHLLRLTVDTARQAQIVDDRLTQKRVAAGIAGRQIEPRLRAQPAPHHPRPQPARKEIQRREPHLKRQRLRRRGRLRWHYRRQLARTEPFADKGSRLPASLEPALSDQFAPGVFDGRPGDALLLGKHPAGGQTAARSQFAPFNGGFQLAGNTLIEREVAGFHYGLLFSSQYGYLLQSIIVLFWLPS